jgi:hypothetical protein
LSLETRKQEQVARSREYRAFRTTIITCDALYHDVVHHEIQNSEPGTVVGMSFASFLLLLLEFCLMLLFGERSSSVFHVPTRYNFELLLSSVLCSMMYAVEVCTVLVFWAVLSGNSLLMFVGQPLQMGQVGCPNILVQNKHCCA